MIQITRFNDRVLKATSRVVLAAFVVALWPQEVLAAVAQEVKQALPAPAPRPRLGNRKLPVTSPAPTAPRFSASPTTEEILKVRVFEEPLVADGAASSAQSRTMADVIERSLDNGRTGVQQDGDPFAEYVKYLEETPASPWRVSLAANLAIASRRAGYFSRVFGYADLAWREGAGSSDPRVRALAARGLAEKAELLARLGRLDDLKELLESLQAEEFSGPVTEKLDQVRSSVWLMENRPEDSYRCGPLAVGAILRELQGRADEKIEAAQSTERGTSLTQMRDLAVSAGMRVRMVHREMSGGVIPTPSMVRWRVGHFAALSRREGSRYLLEDPTFGEAVWITQGAVEEEADGYFLIPEHTAPSASGFRDVSDAEGSTIWGKGAPPTQDSEDQGPEGPTEGGEPDCPRGMASYTFQGMLASLLIQDQPIVYSPPVGPAPDLRFVYNQRDGFQPAVFTYSNVGPKWTFMQMSYVADDPSDPANTVTLYRTGGGQETYTGFDGGTSSYARHFRSRAVLKRLGSPFRYERHLPDGSVEVFAQPDGSISVGRKVFLTEVRDPAGRKLSYVYDSSLRVLAVVDAAGQVTTFGYESADPLKITRITDPFGRYATLAYDTAGRLSSITDVLGLTSSFSYGASDFINAMTTPYGTTRFRWEQSGGNRWIEATDPLGGKEKLLYVNGHAPAIHPASDAAGAPTGVYNGRMDTGMTFYWGKRQMAEVPDQYAHATVTHYAWLPGTNQTSSTRRAVRAPQPGSDDAKRENRVWYQYAGQSSSTLQSGAVAAPVKVGRIVDAGGTQQVWDYQYNAAGKMIAAQEANPAPSPSPAPPRRETRYVYGTETTPDVAGWPENGNDSAAQAGSGIDLLAVKQKNGGSWETLASYTYDANHNVLTATDASGQTTAYTYNARGQVETITTPERDGIAENRTTTMTYDSETGYLLEVEGVDPADTASYTYDGQGRLRTTTDSDDYTLTFDYDALDRPVRTKYPDDTTDETVYEKLHVGRTKDRRGRWTTLVVDALRRTSAVRDPLGRVVTFDWCNCGSLNALIDGKGQRTSWEYDLAGRTVKMIRPDGSSSRYVYEDKTSRLKEALDPRNQKAVIQYFNDNRWKQVSYSDLAGGVASTPTVSFTWDSVYPRLSSITDGTGTTNYAYHAITAPPDLGAGRLASVDGPLTNDTITYAYDELGRVKQRQINGTATLAYEYDELGRVSDETNPLGAFTYGYDGVTGRLLTMDYPNGNQSTFTYFNNAGDHRLQTIHHKKSGGTTISKYDYTYDQEGVIQTWQIQRDASAPQVFDLGHDLADQLVEATLKSTDPTPAIVKSYRYAYDKAENRTSEEIDEAVVKASHNVLNQLTQTTPGGALQFEGTTSEATKTVTVGVVGQTAAAAETTALNEFKGRVEVGSGTTNVEVKATDWSNNTRTNTYEVTQSGSTVNYTYDGNGNMLGDGTRTYEWDAINQLVAVNQGSNRSEFTYDGWGKRVRMVEKVSGSTVADRRFLWCGLEICEERASNGTTVVKRFFSQGVVDNGTSLFYATDHLGSVRELTDTGGTVRARYDYDPYGRTTKVSGDKDSDYTYAGLFAHPASGLHLAVFRAYDASLGRWMSQDPIGMAGGLNLYAPVGNEISGRADPSGLGPMKPVPGHPGWTYRHDKPAGTGDRPHTQVQDRGKEYARRVYPDGTQKPHGESDPKKVNRDVPKEIIDAIRPDKNPYRELDPKRKPSEPSPDDAPQPTPAPTPDPESQFTPVTPTAPSPVPVIVIIILCIIAPAACLKPRTAPVPGMCPIATGPPTEA